MSEFDRLVQPDVQTKKPIGTLAELNAEGLDPEAYHSCSKPDSHNLGCQHWRTCRMTFKGEGPRNLGIEHIKGPGQGGGMARFKADCMWLNRHRDDAIANHGAITVVAQEGETFVAAEEVLVDKVTRKPVPHGSPNAVYQRMQNTITVTPFPRPGASEDVVADILKASVRGEEQERMHNEQRQRALGIQSTEPFDRPKDKGVGGGKK